MMEILLCKKVIFIMGVSGTGKSTVGRLLSNELSVPFIDADDHHLPSNIKKMSQGIPLTDDDRIPWLDQINQIALKHLGLGAVIACSALKKEYRARLSQSIEQNLTWVYLQGSYGLIADRMKNRKGHFMNVRMLKSQFETLQEPNNAMTINVANSPEIIVGEIKSQLVGVKK